MSTFDAVEEPLKPASTGLANMNVRPIGNLRSMRLSGRAPANRPSIEIPRVGAPAAAPPTAVLSAALSVQHSARDMTDEELCAGSARMSRSRFKRLIDIAGALLGLLLLSPALLLVAVLIRLESPGPALFRQRRTGLGGQLFNIYKFRTMRVVEDGPTIVQATRDDHRITRLGGFLRQSCIDEIPQLLNVLKGEMSLIGPRPHALAHDDYYGRVIPDYRSRFLIRPGLSGLAQVSGYRGATPTVEAMAGRVALDLHYVRQWSLGLDIQILWRTLFEGPFHPAAY